MRDGEVIFDGASELLTEDFLHQLYGADSIELTQDEKPAAEVFAEAAVKPAGEGDVAPALPIGRQDKKAPEETHTYQ